MAESNVLKKAKTLITYDLDDLQVKLADAENISLNLFESYLTESDFMVYYAPVSGGSITEFSKGSDDYKTKCQCSTFEDVAYLQNGDKITIASGVYAGIAKVFNLNLTDKTFEIARIFSVDSPALFTNSRKEQLEYAAAYFLLYTIVSSAQEIKNGKVLISSSNWGDGTVNQAGLETKISQAEDYKRRAYQYLNYNFSQVL